MAPRRIRLRSDTHRSYSLQKVLLKNLAVLIGTLFACCAFVCLLAPNLFEDEFGRQDATQLPLLHLDYATYRAALYDKDHDVSCVDAQFSIPLVNQQSHFAKVRTALYLRCNGIH